MDTTEFITFLTNAAASGQRNASVWCQSVCLSGVFFLTGSVEFDAGHTQSCSPQDTTWPASTLCASQGPYRP